MYIMIAALGVAIMLLTYSCQKAEDRVAKLEDRVEKLEKSATSTGPD